MTHNEALIILETIRELYPKYVLTKRKIALLVPQLKRMDYQGVLKKLSFYVATYPYPPTIAEIAAYPNETNTYLEQMQKWQQEAAQVPEETKRKFMLQLEQLVKEHKADED